MWRGGDLALAGRFSRSAADGEEHPQALGSRQPPCTCCFDTGGASNDGKRLPLSWSG